MTIIAKKVNSKNFTWLAVDRVFVIEMSELGGFSQIYDDAADRGITMVSNKTGKEVTFYVSDAETEMNVEGGINNWLLRPTAETIWKIPKLRGVTIKVFND